jgi:hypothetical protein
MQPTPHDIQLMSKHRVLSFKPQLRLKWRGQDGQNETEQPDHSASLSDSITASTQIKFSVHTALPAISLIPISTANQGRFTNPVRMTHSAARRRAADWRDAAQQAGPVRDYRRWRGA